MTPPTPGRGRWPRVAARAVLALYPRRWRRRYGPELDAVLRDTPASPRMLADLALGALDARLHPELTPDPGVPQDGARQAVATMLLAATTLTLVVAGFAKLGEDVTFPGSALADAIARAGLLVAAVAGGAVVARPLLAGLRWSLAERRPGVWLRLAAVPVAGGAWLLSAIVLGRAAGALGGGVAAHGTFLAWAGLSCALAWAAAGAAGTALRLVPTALPVPALGAGLWAVAAGALVSLGGIALWGLLAIARGDGAAPGLGGVPLAPAWTVLLLAVAAAAGILWRTARRPAGADLRA